jgi:hypothetical protein
MGRWSGESSTGAGLAYSDYDVFIFLKMIRGLRVYRCENLFCDTFVKHVFQNFEPFLANRALVSKKC